jgi:hypothetical protein
VTRSENLEIILASAEAVLARTIINSVEASADWVETNLKLGKIRAYCRQLRAALVELNDSESAIRLENARDCCREIRTVLLELNRSASIPFRCVDSSCALLLSPRTTCWLNALDGAVAPPGNLETSAADLIKLPAPSPEQAVQRINTGLSAQKPIPWFTRERPSIQRQAIGFLALILAYLKYYFIEIQLEILSLPAILALPLP